MNPFEEFLVGLLQGHISYDGRRVEVRREFMPTAYIPCITLEIVSDQNEYYRRTYMTGHECLCFKHVCNINVHVWCNTESERESINEQVLDCYYRSLNHDYLYCSNYDDGQCSILNSSCAGIGAYKRKCPHPTGYKYQCLSDKHELCFGTINIESPFHMDEHDRNPPVLHSVFRAYTDYLETVAVMGDSTQSYTFDSDIVVDQMSEEGYHETVNDI